MYWYYYWTIAICSKGEIIQGLIFHEIFFNKKRSWIYCSINSINLPPKNIFRIRASQESGFITKAEILSYFSKNLPFVINFACFLCSITSGTRMNIFKISESFGKACNSMTSFFTTEYFEMFKVLVKNRCRTQKRNHMRPCHIFSKDLGLYPFFHRRTFTFFRANYLLRLLQL